MSWIAGYGRFLSRITAHPESLRTLTGNAQTVQVVKLLVTEGYLRVPLIIIIGSPLFWWARLESGVQES